MGVYLLSITVRNLAENAESFCTGSFAHIFTDEDLIDGDDDFNLLARRFASRIEPFKHGDKTFPYDPINSVVIWNVLVIPKEELEKLIPFAQTEAEITASRQSR